MRAQMMVILVLLAGCDSFKNVPCGQCEKFGAVCNPVTNLCQLGPLDMAVSVEGDMARTTAADLSTVDGPTPPMCTPATVTADCLDAAKPVCGNDGNCRACDSSADDPVCKAQSSATPHCQVAGANAGQCVQCTAATQATDCGGIAPICGSDGSCRKCQAHSECPPLGMWPDTTPIPGICIFDGVNPGGCADPASVAYVDNGDKAVSACKMPSTMAHNGQTPATAYCDVQDAILAAAPQPYVVVRGRGSTHDYGDPTTGGTAVNIARAVTIIGPGGSAATTAQISSTNAGVPCITVGGTGLVVLDGLEIANGNNGIGSIGVTCGAGSSLVARRNSIHTNVGGGVSATSCVLTLDANDIENNAAGGVTLGASQFSITNNIIAGSSANGSYGVKINDNPSGSTFAFNTVANNNSGVAATPAGIICNAATTIQFSIVAVNSAPAGTQFSGSCTLSSVVTGTDSANPGNTAGPALTADYRLDIGTTQNENKNKACCIDKLPTPSTPFADHDVDFTLRPKGTGATPYDIGAAEAE